MDKPRDTASFLANKAIDIRKAILDVSLRAHSGHFGGSLSAVDILVALYYQVLRYDPKAPAKPDRDRFVLSKGHALLGLAPILADSGFFPQSFMDNYNGLDSAFGMHPNMRYIPGIDMSTGSLGHGLSVSVGMALAARLDKASYQVYCLLGDGELDEGMIWEAAMSAAHFRLSNLTAIVDRNRLSLDGKTEDVMRLEPLKAKWEAFGWRVIPANGHDMGSLLSALEAAREGEGPAVIIAETIKGKGVAMMEGQTNWHYGGLDEETVEALKAELEKGRVM